MSDYVVVGVDIAKDKFDAVMLKDNKSEHGCFENTEGGFKLFVAWMKKRAELVWVCMESTGHYSEPLADYLYEKGIRVSMVNPLQIKSFAKLVLARNKNDKLDACLIAHYCKQMKPRLFVSRSQEQKNIREIVQLIDTLKDQVITLNNQRRSTATALAKESFEHVLQSLKTHIKQLEKKLDALVKSHAEFSAMVELMISVKGIGRTSAYRFLAYLPPIHLFQNAKQLAAFIGVTPMQYESGKIKGKTRMSHFGHKRLKKALYMPALVAKNKNNHLQPFVQRLKKNGLAPKAIVGALMRKLTHIIFGILKSNKTFNQQLACAL